MALPPNTKHSPTPWRTRDMSHASHYLNPHRPCFEISVGINGQTVATGLSAADCAHIVRCVNAHDELVAVLTRILSCSNNTMARGSKDITDWQDDNRIVGNIARAALAKAGS